MFKKRSKKKQVEGTIFDILPEEVKKLIFSHLFYLDRPVTTGLSEQHHIKYMIKMRDERLQKIANEILKLPNIRLI